MLWNPGDSLLLEELLKVKAENQCQSVDPEVT